MATFQITHTRSTHPTSTKRELAILFCHISEKKMNQ